MQTDQSRQITFLISYFFSDNKTVKINNEKFEIAKILSWQFGKIEDWVFPVKTERSR